MAYPYSNIKTKPIASNTNVTSFSDPFTGESFILPTSAHNTQAKINYDRQKESRKRTQGLIELDPQTAEAMLLNIGGAWEEGQLREQFMDIRKTGTESERKKAAQKAEAAAIDDLTDQAKNMYKDEKGMLGYMEKNAGIRNLMKQAYRSNQPTLKAYNELAQQHEEKFFKTQQIGINDGMKLHETIDKIRGKLEDDEAHLSNMLKRRSDPNADWSDADEATIRKLKDTVVINRNLVNRGEKKLGRGIPDNMFELGKRTKKLKNEQPIKNEKTGKEEPTLWQQLQSFISGDSPIADLPPLIQRNRSQDTSLNKEQQLALAQQAEGKLGTPSKVLNEQALQEAVEATGGVRRDPGVEGFNIDEETISGRVRDEPPLVRDEPITPPINLEGTSDSVLPEDWRTRQGTQSDIRGRGSLADQFAPSMNLDGTSAQEVTTPVATTDQVATTPIEPFTAEEVVVVEKETGVNIGDVDKVVKLIEAKEGKGVAQKVLDRLSEFTNHVVKQVTSRDYQRSIIGLDRFRPDEDTPDPNEGTTTPSEGGTPFFKGLNMMASSGYESVAPPVREGFGWAVDKIKKYWDMFKDTQSRDTSSSQRDPYSGSSEEMMNQAIQKKTKNKTSDIAKWVQESGVNVPGFPMVKHITAQELQESSGGKDTEHKGVLKYGYPPIGNHGIYPTTALERPYFKDKGINDLDKIAKELEDPRVNTIVAAQYADWLHGQLKKHPLVGKWATSNHFKKRKDFIDLVTGSHNYGIGNMKKLLDSMQDDDDIDDILRYLENARSPRDKQLYTHILGYRKHRKDRRK